MIARSSFAPVRRYNTVSKTAIEITPIVKIGKESCLCGMPGIKNRGDRKSTRLNSSHLGISYAVFCLKKKKYSRGSVPSKRTSTTTNKSKNVLRQQTYIPKIELRKQHTLALHQCSV